MNSPKVGIIVLNWNNKKDLIETIQSINQQKNINKELIIVDNFSNDDSWEYICKNYSNNKLIRAEKNLGYAGGNNLGIEYAIKNEADYIILANNDIIIENKNLIAKLLQDFVELENINVGILGTKVNYFAEKDISHNIGFTEYSKHEPKRYFNEYKKKYSSVEMANNYKLVDAVSGCFMIVKSDVFKRIGALDERFFMYAEDTDFCLRAWENGYSCIVSKSDVIHHKISATSGYKSAFSVYYRTRNLYYLLKKHKNDLGHTYFYLKLFHFGIIKNLIKNFAKMSIFKAFKINLIIIKAWFHAVILKKTGKTF